MQWSVGKVVVCNPATHLVNHVYVIIYARDDKVGDFYPHIRIAHGEKGVENRLEISSADSPVYIVTERFQVDVGCVEVG